ncbi:MAG: hypothetical protein ACLFRP_06415 [Puniceicoccaceae bacterium]
MLGPAYSALKKKLPHWAQPYLAAHWLFYFLCRRKVLAGPFAGLRYIHTSIGSAYYNKLIATYEIELHGEVERLKALAPAKIIDVGTAEGYYAAGFARAVPGSRVVAFEGEELGRRLQKRLLRRNGLEDRVRVEGFCDRATLSRELEGEDAALVILDCEGYEKELFDPAAIPALARCHLLIELHFFADSDIREVIRERSAHTHEATHVRTRERTLADFPADPVLRFAPRALKRYFMLEGRNEATEWLILRPLANR